MTKRKHSDIYESVNNKKVAIYVRVSTVYQIDKDSLGIQKKELIAYSEMVLGIKDYVIFEDPGYSAKNTDRPEYQRMMSRLRTGEFSHLLVWKIDRISRNLLYFSQMYTDLKSLGVVFVSKNEQFDTSNAIGEAMLKIILVFAELERNMTSERVSAVLKSRVDDGKWNGGRVPFGYDYDKATKEFSINPQEQAIVKLIYNMYEQYQSLLYVSRYLNESNIKTRAGNPWNVTSVYKILTSVFYVGNYRYNVRIGDKGVLRHDEEEWKYYMNHHVPIVNEEQFERVQRALKRNKRGGNTAHEAVIKKNIHLFAGLLRCEHCGRTMSATQDRRRANGWRPSIYACQTRRANDSSCKAKYVSDVMLGPFVFNYIGNIIRAKESVGARTTLETLEKKLLRGPAFENVLSIDTESLSGLKELFTNSSEKAEYKPPLATESFGIDVSEQHLLQERKVKLENALNRLKTLFLYSDQNISENEFIDERNKIMSELEDIDYRLSLLAANNDNDANISDEFIEKASYYIMVEKLLEDRYINFEKYIRNIEPGVPRNFLQSVISSITISDGKITSIVFKNGKVHKFMYKEKTQSL